MISKFLKYLTTSCAVGAMLLTAATIQAQTQINVLSVDVDQEVGFPRVKANVSVNSANASQCLLTSQHFTILEDSVQQTITSLDCSLGGALSVDFVLLFDDTGSMFQEISVMQEKATEFAQDILNAGIDAQFALVSFKDVSRTVVDITDDIGKFQTGVNSLFAAAGGDRPEAALDAVYHSLDNLSFRDTSLKIYLIVTDAPTHYRNDGTLFSSFSIPEMSQLVNNQGGSVFVVSPDFSARHSFIDNDRERSVHDPKGRDGETLSGNNDLRLLAESTGGLWLDINSSSDFSVFLEQVIQALQAIYTITWDSNSTNANLEREVCITVDDPLEGSASGCKSYLGPPTNDDFSRRNALRHDERYNVIVTTNISASKESGEPDHAGNPGGASLWFDWTAPKDGVFVFHTLSLDGTDSLLSAYQGTKLEDLVLVAESDDSPDFAAVSPSKSQIRFEAKKGEHFVIALDGKDGSRGKMLLWYYDLSWDDIEYAEVFEGIDTPVVVMNIGATAKPQEPVIQGSQVQHSIWFQWTPGVSAPIRISLDMDQVVSPFHSRSSLLAVYRGTPDDLEFVKSVRGQYLDIDVLEDESYYVQFDGIGGEFLLGEITFEPRPANDFTYAAATLSGASGSYDGNSFGATSQTSEPSHAGKPANASVWHNYDSRTSNGTLAFNVTTKTEEPRVAAYRRGFDYVTSNIAPYDSEFDEIAMMFPLSETTYNIAFDTSDRGGKYTLSWKIHPKLTDDEFEANDDFESATDLVAIESSKLDQLVSRNDDYYRMSLPGFTTLAAAILFNDSMGDLDLLLYRQEGDSQTVVDDSVSSENIERVTYSNNSKDEQIMFLRVQGDSNDLYQLRYQLTGNSVPVQNAILDLEPAVIDFDVNSDGIIDAADLVTITP